MPAKDSLRTKRTCSLGVTNCYSAGSSIQFSEQNWLKTLLRWPSIKRIDKVTMFIIHCHLLMCIVGFFTISTCLMHCYGLFKISTIIYWVQFMWHALNSFIYLNVQIALEKTNIVDVTTEVDKLIYFICSIHLVVSRFTELQFCLLFCMGVKLGRSN